MSCLLASGGQSIGASASATVLPMNMQYRFPLGLTGLISLQSKGLSKILSSTTVRRHQFFGAQPFFYCPALTTITWGLKTTQIYKVPVPLGRSSNMGLKSSSVGCVYSGCSRGRPSSLFFPASRGCLLMAPSSIFLSSSTAFLHHHISFSDTPVSLFHFKDQQ